MKFNRTFIIVTLVLALIVVLATPRFQRFFERSLALADIMETIKQSPPPEYPSKDGFYHFGEIYPGATREIRTQTFLEKIQFSIDEQSVAIKHDYGPPLGKQWQPLAAPVVVLRTAPYAHSADARMIIRQNLDAILARSEKTPEGNMVFPYTFDWMIVGQKSPWYSAMAQGISASAFLWGYRTLGDEKYLVAARQSLLALGENEPVQFVNDLKVGIWLKEYPGYRFNVLDGFLTTVSGLFDYLKTAPANDPAKPELKKLLDESLKGFKSVHHCYSNWVWGHSATDFGEWNSLSYYRANLSLLTYLSNYDTDLKKIASEFRLRPRPELANKFIAIMYRAVDFLKNKKVIPWNPCF